MGNFHVKTPKSTDFAHTFSKNYSFICFFFSNKDYTFYTTNLFIWPKNCVQSIFYNKKCKKFRKNQFFCKIFTFLSITLQNFEDNLRILANFGKISYKNSIIYGFRPYFFKKLVFFLIKIIVFTLKIYSFGPKIVFKSCFYYERCKKFRKNQFFIDIFTFLSETS